MSSTTAEGTLSGRHGPVPIRRYRPVDGLDESTPLIWLHGGAFSHGGLDQVESDAPARRLAEAGRTVVTVDYHRVGRWSAIRDPREEGLTGVRFPVPLEDVVDVVTAVSRDAPSGEVLLGGASAGACLAASAALDLVRSGRHAVAGLALVYGTFHAALPSVPPKVRSRIRGWRSLVQFRPATVHRMNLNYAGSRAAMADPRAFPGGHDLRGLPPTLVLDADRDSLRASGEAFADELLSAGVDVEHDVVLGSMHGFLDRPSRPEFGAGMARVEMWLERRRRLDRG